MKPRKKAGGKRPGAGRKPDPLPRSVLQIRLPASAYAAIKGTPGGYEMARERLTALAAELAKE